MGHKCPRCIFWEGRRDYEDELGFCRLEGCFRFYWCECKSFYPFRSEKSEKYLLGQIKNKGRGRNKMACLES